MKLLPLIGVLSASAAAFAQGSAATHGTSAHKSDAPLCDSGLPTLSQTIPSVPGCPKVLYALKYIDLSVGAGPLAKPMQIYTVNYTGYLADGSKFDSSVDRKQPIIFPQGLHRVMMGWETGFEGMHVGGKRRLFIPYQLGYGDEGKPPSVPGSALLIYDVELLKQENLPPQRPVSHPNPSSTSETPQTK